MPCSSLLAHCAGSTVQRVRRASHHISTVSRSIDVETRRRAAMQRMIRRTAAQILNLQTTSANHRTTTTWEKAASRSIVTNTTETSTTVTRDVTRSCGRKVKNIRKTNVLETTSVLFLLGPSCCFTYCNLMQDNCKL